MRFLRVLCVSVAVLSVGCGFVREHRLRGQWKTDATPERTLDLFADGTYSLRLSGKGLGFVSELLGPERGKWRVEADVLVLFHVDEKGIERTQRWPINEIHRDELVVAGERWRRVPPKGES